MKYAKPIVRSLLGFIFAASAIAFFAMPTPQLPPGDMATFFAGMAATKYFFYLLKSTELICGLLLLSGSFVPLALVILSPIIINIFCVHVFLDRTNLPVAIVIVALHISLAYMYRDYYKPLLKRK